MGVLLNFFLSVSRYVMSYSYIVLMIFLVSDFLGDYFGMCGLSVEFIMCLVFLIMVNVLMLFSKFMLGSDLMMVIVLFLSGLGMFIC